MRRLCYLPRRRGFILGTSECLRKKTRVTKFSGGYIVHSFKLRKGHDDAILISSNVFFITSFKPSARPEHHCAAISTGSELLEYKVFELAFSASSEIHLFYGTYSAGRDYFAKLR